MAKLRPLGALSTLLVALGAITALEVGVRALYEPPAPMLDKAQAYAAVPHEASELLIFGTCLPEQIIQTQQLGELVGAQVYNLATPAGTSRLFYLTLLHHIPEDAPIEAIVVPFGAGDLTKLMAPYESQVMELAEWSDLPDLIDWACQGDSACATEMTVRKASAAYRYRGYLANRFWQGLGLKEPIPGYVLSPGAVEPPKMDGGDAPPPQGPQPGQDQAASGEDFQPLDISGPGADAKYVHLVQFLALAEHRGIPVIFVPLPERSQLEVRQSGAGNPNAERDAELAQVIRDGGADVLDVYALPGLSARHFEDEVHLRPDGRVIVTQAIGNALAGRLDR